MGRMNFRDIQNTAFVDDVPIVVNGEPDAKQLLQQIGYDPEHRSLVQFSSDGRGRILAANDRINLDHGDRFEAQLNATGGC